MHLDNIDYFRERAAAERKLAEAADNADAAAIHEVLARRYEALVREAELSQATQGRNKGSFIRSPA